MSGTVTGNASTTRTGSSGFAIAGLVCGIIRVFLFVLIALAGSHHGHFYWHVR